jgi:hypothetical protein
MKTGVPRDPRISRLARALGCSKLEAIGLIEMLFHFAMDHADDGGVGRFEPEDIADGLQWDRDPEALQSALISSGWIVPSKESRLVVADWPTHAPEFIHRRLSRSGRRFLSGQCPVNGRTPSGQGPSPSGQSTDVGAPKERQGEERIGEDRLGEGKGIDYHLDREEVTAVAASAEGGESEDWPPEFQAKGEKTWRPGKAFLAKLKSAYPGLEFEPEVRRAALWTTTCEESKRRDPGAMANYLRNWLGRAKSDLDKLRANRQETNVERNRRQAVEWGVDLDEELPF